MGVIPHRSLTHAQWALAPSCLRISAQSYTISTQDVREPTWYPGEFAQARNLPLKISSVLTLVVAHWASFFQHLDARSAASMESLNLKKIQNLCGVFLDTIVFERHWFEGLQLFQKGTNGPWYIRFIHHYCWNGTNPTAFPPDHWFHLSRTDWPADKSLILNNSTIWLWSWHTGPPFLSI